VQGVVSEAARTPTIVAFGPAPSYHASVAQYQVDSIDSLKQKLGQFSNGTHFRWSFSGDEKEGLSILADLRTYLKDRGMTIY
jgi:hypothetical protein